MKQGWKSHKIFRKSRKSPNAECCFSDRCPYLRGQSPNSLLTELYYLRKRVDELEGMVNFSTNEIIRLRNIIKELEEEKKQLSNELLDAKRAPFRKYEKEDSAEKIDEDKEKKKRGAPYGHKGRSRKRPERIDEYIDVFLTKCPGCGNTKLGKCSHTTEHVQEDIESGKLKVRCYIHHYYWCSECKKVVHGIGENEIPHAAIGPDARAKAVFLRHEIKISYDDTPRVLEYLCGLKISPGTIVNFDNQLYKKAEPLYKTLKNSLRKSQYIHADETGWNRDWLWIFTNNQITFFHIDEHRSSDVVIEHLGSSYNGILITDFYSAYRTRIDAFAKQKCCTHLLRDIRALLKKNIPENSDAALFLNNLKNLIQSAIELYHKYPVLPSEYFRSERKKILKQFKKLRSKSLAHEEAETLRKRLITHKNEIFTFLKFPHLIEPTNNIAEQRIRHCVLFRKITFGNRTTQGKKNVSLILTLIRTAILNKIDPVNIIKSLFIHGITHNITTLFHLTSSSSADP